MPSISDIWPRTAFSPSTSSSILSRWRRCIAAWPSSFGTNVRWFETKEDGEYCQAPISWAIYTQDQTFFEAPIVRRAVSPWRDDGKSELVWTDKDSNLMSIVNWTRP